MRKFDPQRLRNIRNDRRYSLEMTARLLRMRQGHKVSRAAISHWERGVSGPSLDSLAALADLFNVPIDYFFTGCTNCLLASQEQKPMRDLVQNNTNKSVSNADRAMAGD